MIYELYCLLILNLCLFLLRGYPTTSISNNVRKCLLKSDFLASCSGISTLKLLYFRKVRGYPTTIVINFLGNISGHYFRKYWYGIPPLYIHFYGFHIIYIYLPISLYLYFVYSNIISSIFNYFNANYFGFSFEFRPIYYR